MSQLSCNCHLNVVAVYADAYATTQSLGAVHSLDAAVAKADRMTEEGDWPEGHSLWAVGPKKAFQYSEDENLWTEETGDLANFMIAQHHPVIN